jgi:hypothetical protein
MVDSQQVNVAVLTVDQRLVAVRAFALRLCKPIDDATAMRQLVVGALCCGHNPLASRPNALDCAQLRPLASFS